MPSSAHRHVPCHQLMPDISGRPGACANMHSSAVTQQALTAAGLELGPGTRVYRGRVDVRGHLVLSLTKMRFS